MRSLACSHKDELATVDLLFPTSQKCADVFGQLSFVGPSQLRTDTFRFALGLVIRALCSTLLPPRCVSVVGLALQNDNLPLDPAILVVKPGNE